MNRHKCKIHKNIRHPCNQCEYVATFSNTLRRHVKTVHEGNESKKVKRKISSSDVIISEEKAGQFPSWKEEFEVDERNDDTSVTVAEPLNIETDSVGPSAPSQGMKKRTSGRRERKFTCDECGHKTKTRAHMKTHINVKHKGIKYKCDQCDYVANYMYRMTQHKASVHDGVIYPCDQCDYTAKRKDLIKIHIETVHEKKNVHLCDQCGHASYTKAAMLAHKHFKHCTGNKNENRKLTNQRLRNTVTSNYLCDACSFLTDSSTDLILHKESVHEGKGKRYPCEQCGYVGVVYSCDECEFSASLKWLLTRHKNAIHKNLKIQCDQCDYVATYQYRLDQHKANIHQGINHPCDQCEYVSKTKEGLKSHKEAKHLGIRYLCDQCTFSSTTKGDLTRHKHRKHSV